jgi:lysozyme
MMTTLAQELVPSYSAPVSVYNRYVFNHETVGVHLVISSWRRCFLRVFLLDRAFQLLMSHEGIAMSQFSFSEQSMLDFLTTIKNNEGSLEYQRKRGIFKNGLFSMYKDSLGFNTIGYGHLVKSSENFSNGINETQADDLLRQDVNGAIQDADHWIPLQSQPEAVQKVLVEMVFQLGINKAKKFIKFASAIQAKDYCRAGSELKNSSWYQQTPQRVEQHVSDLQKI